VSLPDIDPNYPRLLIFRALFTTYDVAEIMLHSSLQGNSVQVHRFSILRHKHKVGGGKGYRLARKCDASSRMHSASVILWSNL